MPRRARACARHLPPGCPAERARSPSAACSPSSSSTSSGTSPPRQSACASRSSTSASRPPSSSARSAPPVRDRGDPLGGFVRIVGMGRPRGKDLRACEEAAEKAAEKRAPGEPDRVTPRSSARGRRSTPVTPPRAARRSALLAAAIEADAELIDDERVGWCTEELERVGEDADPRAYWRMAVWRRITAIVAGPAANLLARVRRADDVLWPRHPELRRHDLGAAGAGRPRRRSAWVSSPAMSSSASRASGWRRPEAAADDPDLPEGHAARAPCRQAAHARPAGSGTPPSAISACSASSSTSSARAPLTFRPLRSAHPRRAGALARRQGHGDGAQEPRLQGRPQQRAGRRRHRPRAVDRRRPGLYLEQLAWLSLSLALFNLLPFLPLDGGHVLFALIERLRRRPLSREIYERVSLGGIAVFLVLFLLVLQQDVGRIIDGARPGP